MIIELNNLNSVTTKSFNEFIFGEPKSLNNIIDFLQKPSNSLESMLKEEFQYKFNSLFVKELLEGTKIYFPENIRKFPSIFILKWNEYFEDKYKDFKQPVRNFSFDEIKKEKEKLLYLIGSGVTKNNIETLQEKILDNFPYDDKSNLRYKTSLKNIVFLLAKLDLLKNYSNVEEDLNTLIKSYYSSFDHNNKESNVFKIYFNSKTDMDKISQEKINFFKPKNSNESNFLQQIFKNKDAFKKAFSNVAGFSDEKEKLRMEDLFLIMMITHNHSTLETNLPFKYNQVKIKTKKI